MPHRLGEFARIDRFLKPLAAGFPGALGLTDDAGLLTLDPDQELVVTTDAMVAGVHYLQGEDPGRLARKLLRVNLSDLAAMGARPLAYTLTTALPPDAGEAWLEAFAGGLAADQQIFHIHLLGGDSVPTAGPALVSITAFGLVPHGQALRRSGARVGDAIYVSGCLGDGALGLKAARGGLPGLDAASASALAEHYHLPQPRVALGERLIGVANACVDLSDGLPGDLAHICSASGVAAVVDAENVPLSKAAQAAISGNEGLRAVALSGGDDYELLFTVPPSAEPRLKDLSGALKLQLTRIGVVTAGSGVRIQDAQGQPIQGLSGWTHF